MRISLDILSRIAAATGKPIEFFTGESAEDTLSHIRHTPICCVP
ncbi:MAG: hypothetical protein K6U12_10115 [Armatimonadetes bacterium]|nr:hypothetical protein [Armatimonadota bacterium]